MMSAHPVVVEIISENGRKKVTLDGLGSANAWEVTKQLNHQLSKEKCKHRGECSAVSQVTVLRDHLGVRLKPHSRVQCKRGVHLFAEVSVCIDEQLDGMPEDKVTGLKGGATRKSINSGEDRKMDSYTVSSEASKRTLGKTNAQSPSPSKTKRRKMEGEDSESHSDTDWTTETKAKRKSLNSLRSETGDAIPAGAERQESQCAACGRTMSPSPTVTLELKHGFASGQPPSSINLRLRQRSCAMCSEAGRENLASTEQGRQSQAPRTDPAGAGRKGRLKETGAPVNKNKDANGKASRDDNLSSSLQSIHLGDKTDQRVRSSQNTVTEEQKKSSKKPSSAMASREAENCATGKGTNAVKGDQTRGKEITSNLHDTGHKYPKSPITKGIKCAKEHSDNGSTVTGSSEQHVDDHQKQGKTKKPDLAGERLDANGEHVPKKTTNQNATTCRTKERGSTEKPADVKSKYFSTTINKNEGGVTASANGKHSETKCVDAKETTSGDVDNALCSSASVSKAERLADIGGKHSETPVITVDSTKLATALESRSKKRKSPALVGKQQPEFVKIIEGRGDETDGLCNPSQGGEGNTLEDTSFVGDIDGKEYTDLDSVPVEISDTQEGFKDDCSVSDDGDPVVVNIGRNELKQSDLETLQEGEWLNDCVINAYFHLLSERSSLNIFTHSSFFFFSLYKRGYEGVQRWTKNVDLFAQDLLFVPVHNKSHWTLVVVHVKEGVIEYYNSSTLLDGYPRSMVHIQKYLHDEAVHRGKDAFSNVTWEMYILDQIPRQQNMDDCGLFICQYAKKLSLKQKVVFGSTTTTNLRKQMLRELLGSNIEVP